MPNSADHRYSQQFGESFEHWIWIVLAFAAAVMILGGMINPNPPSELPALLQPWRP